MHECVFLHIMCNKTAVFLQVFADFYLVWHLPNYCYVEKGTSSVHHSPGKPAQ